MSLPLQADLLQTRLDHEGFVGTLVPVYETERGLCYRFSTPSTALFPTWQRLSGLTPQTGFWPLAITYGDPIPVYQQAIFGTDTFRHDGWEDLLSLMHSPVALTDAIATVIALDVERDIFDSTPTPQALADWAVVEKTGILDVMPEEEQEAYP